MIWEIDEYDSFHYFPSLRPNVLKMSISLLYQFLLSCMLCTHFVWFWIQNITWNFVSQDEVFFPPKSALSWIFNEAERVEILMCPLDSAKNEKLNSILENCSLSKRIKRNVVALIWQRSWFSLRWIAGVPFVACQENEN